MLQKTMLKKVIFIIILNGFQFLVQETVEENVTTVSLINIHENPETVYFLPDKLLKKSENCKKPVI